jgi:hypothetical protein
VQLESAVKKELTQRTQRDEAQSAQRREESRSRCRVVWHRCLAIVVGVGLENAGEFEDFEAGRVVGPVVAPADNEVTGAGEMRGGAGRRSVI